MHTDPIADLLTRIRNATKAHHQEVEVSHSVIKEKILSVLKEKGYIEDYKIEKNGSFKVLIAVLKENYELNLRRISTPGQRIYVKSNQLKMIKNGLGIQIISTPKGIMTNMQAKKQNLGGELLCEIY